MVVLDGDAERRLGRVWNELVVEAAHLVASGRSDVVVVDLPAGDDGSPRGEVDFLCVVTSTTAPDAAVRSTAIRTVGRADVFALESTPSLAARSPNRRDPVGLRALGVAAVAAGTLLAAWIVNAPRSAFMDEEISLVMGLRAWEGMIGQDGFRRWVTGSPVSPAMSAAAAQLGGLTAARLLSAVLVVAACAVMSIAAARAVLARTAGDRAAGEASGVGVALMTFAATLCTTPVLVLATQVTHDSLASFALACAFGSMVMARVTSRRLWLATAALWCGIAGVVAYAAFAMALPLLLLAASGMVANGGLRAAPLPAGVSRRRTDLVLAVMVFSLAPILMLSLYGADIDALRLFLSEEAPGLSMPRADLAVELAWVLAVPSVLAVIGAISRRSARRGGLRTGTAIELLALATMPALHLASGVGQAALRHCAYGIIAAAPLLGEGARFVLGRRPRLLGVAVVGAMAFAAVGLTRAANHSWSDLEPALDFLAAEAAPDDRIVSVHEWPVAGALYRNGVLASPWNVTGPDRQRAAGEPLEVCTAQWYVEDLTRPGAAELRSEVDACGTFVEELRYEQRVEAAPGSGDRGGTVVVSVWRNSRMRP